MEIRDYIDADFEEIQLLAKKYEINIPSDGKIIVVVNDEGIILAFSCIRLIPFVEPMIGESPVASVKLWNYLDEKLREGNMKVLRCYTDQKNKELFEKVGFKQVFNDKITMEKYYQRG